MELPLVTAIYGTVPKRGEEERARGGDHQPTLPSHSNRSCLLSRTLMLTFYISTARDLACLLHCNDFINKQTIVSIDSTDALFIQMFFGFVQFIG